VAVLELRAAPEVAAYLEQAKRTQIAELEARHQKTLRLVSVPGLLPEQFEVAAFGPDGRAVEAR
jgi:Ribonuclease G/E